MNSIIKKLLAQRGITEENEIGEFLSDTPKKTYDPFLLPDMEAGVDLILAAIKNNKQICIYGDYDADGITSTCIMKTILERAGGRVSYFIPSRFTDGYGLNSAAIDRLRSGGAEVLITVDCGSVSREEVAHAEESGLEVVVTDHHNIDDVQADCILINPKRKDCVYPFRDLAGCGVAYKFAQAIQRKAGLPKSAIADILDLAAIGTVGDIVPLVDENRTLVKYGLKEIKKSRRPGLDALIRGISLSPDNIASEQIAFGIVPNLNACGRMEDAGIGARLLLAGSAGEADPLVEKVTSLNRSRKQIQEDTYEECLKLAAEQCPGSDFPVIYAGGAHEGITGIVAGKLKEKFGRPVIVVTDSGDDLKGTGRSIEGVDIYAVMNRQNSLFKRFGGHRGACGFTMEASNLDDLRCGLDSEMALIRENDPSVFDSGVNYDLELLADEVDIKLAGELMQLEPFGNSNELPVFMIRGAEVSDVFFMGQKNQHMRFTAVFPGGVSFKCVLFGNAGEYRDLILSGAKIRLFGSIGINEWNGYRNVQMNLIHIEDDRENR
ncbi:MAG: single-stranded-DNA-specific exonuclease RecJ [Eubacteriaceae bacterium]|jgi:single-stranded-DNA-specific exonuclease|nr:single-stranded-DNA-specific exonuclease RecJ [Eubacteriaceae bacterium]